MEEKAKDLALTVDTTDEMAAIECEGGNGVGEREREREG